MHDLIFPLERSLTCHGKPIIGVIAESQKEIVVLLNKLSGVGEGQKWKDLGYVLKVELTGKDVEVKEAS